MLFTHIYRMRNSIALGNARGRRTLGSVYEKRTVIAQRRMIVIKTATKKIKRGPKIRMGRRGRTGIGRKRREIERVIGRGGGSMNGIETRKETRNERKNENTADHQPLLW